MGVNLVDFHDSLLKRRTFGFFDDLEWFVTAHRFTSLVADAGTSIAVGDTANGEAVLTTAATDNNEVLIRTTNEVLKFLNNKPIVVEARLKYTEANTDDANVCFGMADAMGANLMVDDGAGPKTTMSGLLIFKVDGGTAWKVISSLAADQTISTSTAVPGGGTYQTLRIEWTPLTSTSGEAKFYIDGQQLIDATTLKPIKHTFTYTSATEMHMGVYAKAGGANSEVVTVDYVACEQLR